MHPRLLACVPLFVLVAGRAAAQDAITLGAVEAYGTIHAGGVTVASTGDADADATGYVEYRAAGSAAYRRGHALSRLPGGRLTASLLRLQPGTTYDVRVTVTDPDNTGPLTATGSLVTRADDPPAATGSVIYVDGATGADNNDGSAAHPLRTVQAAADRAAPGDTVRVRAGIYREQVIPTSGTPAAPILFLAEPGAVLDGADAELAGGTASWTDDGNGTWSTPFSSESLYAAVDGARLYDYQSLADLQEQNGNIGTPGAVEGGFFVDAAAQRLHVRLPDGAPPAGRSIQVAVLPSAFLLDTVTDVMVDGFEIRHYGSVQYSGVGVDIRDSARCRVRNNHVHHMNAAVRVRRALASENVIERNVFRDTGVYGWPWASAKAHTPEASAISITHGHGNVVRWNNVAGSFNGIYVGDFSDGSEEIGRDTDVYENVLAFHGDDGMEFEGANVRVRAWENVLTEVYNAISLAPVQAGPLLLVRNVIHGYQQHAFKVNNAPTGDMFIYHTTALPLPPARFPDAQVMSPSEPFGGLHLRNNILQGNRYVIEYGLTTLAGEVDLDFDALHTVDVGGAGRFVKWLNVRYADLAALAASGTIESHGFGAAPLYEDEPGGNLALVAGHALLDVAQVIPGVNDADAVGGGPDVGAFERGGLIPGPDAPLPVPDAGPLVSSSSGPVTASSPGGSKPEPLKY